jgi:hypothetical protein
MGNEAVPFSQFVESQFATVAVASTIIAMATFRSG